jgi:starch phosphorylase
MTTSARTNPAFSLPIRETLLDRGDYYLHLADLPLYAQAQQQVSALYADQDAWVRKAIINVACSGKFSSDRTIEEYASGIWGALPCPVPAGAALNNGGARS